MGGHIFGTIPMSLLTSLLKLAAAPKGKPKSTGAEHLGIGAVTILIMKITNIKQMLGRTLSRLLRSAPSFSAMITVKSGLPCINVFKKLIPLLGRRGKPSLICPIVNFSAQLHQLYKTNGVVFLVKTLKAASVMLQQSLGGQRLETLNPLGVRIARTNRGLPRMIPRLHRAEIRKGSRVYIKLWMSLFGVYRVIDFPKTVLRVNLTSITQPSRLSLPTLIKWLTFVEGPFCLALKQNVPHPRGTIVRALMKGGVKEFLKELKAVSFLIPKASPVASGENVAATPQSTSPAAILASAYVWIRSPLYPLLKQWCQATGSTWLINRIEAWTSWDPHIDILCGGAPLTPDGPDSPFAGRERLGRLGFKVEPAGKIRVFAMVDCITQWLMKPLHENIFSLLKQIPQDGTFDQMRPIQRLQETWSGPLYSFDLSSATDRIPLELQKALLTPFLGVGLAEVWGRLLVDREYTHGSNSDWKLKAGAVKYAAGQPMGALSSWAMLALTHHALVQWSALRVGAIRPGEWYLHYAILGDDVVIGGTKVADEYLEIMREIDVSISFHKSLVSVPGLALEFAKRTFYQGNDVSMVPMAELLVAQHNVAALMELARKYSLNSIGALLSVLGYGYKVKGSLNSILSRMNSRVRYYLTSFYGPGGPRFVGLKPWLTMRSLGSSYQSADRTVSDLLDIILQQERKSLLERCEQLKPLVERAKKLATVYRDREHYGASPHSGNRVTVHPGLILEIPQRVIDSVNETVYRTAWLDVQIDFRDLVNSIMDLTILPPSWEAIETLWKELDRIEDLLGSLALSENIHTRVSEATPRSVIGINQKRWLRYNGVFRKTQVQ